MRKPTKARQRFHNGDGRSFHGTRQTPRDPRLSFDAMTRKPRLDRPLLLAGHSAAQLETTIEASSLRAFLQPEIFRRDVIDVCADASKILENK